MRLKTPSGHVFVRCEDIIHLDACGSYTNIFVRNIKEFFHESHRLGYFCIKLKDNPEFCRIHKSYCVNVNYIGNDEGKNVFLKDGAYCPVSRTGKKILKQQLA